MSQQPPDPSMEIPDLVPAQWYHGVVPMNVTEPGEDGEPITRVRQLVMLRIARKGGALGILLDPADASKMAADIENAAAQARTGLIVAGGLARPAPGTNGHGRRA